jgi:hypothetical protein
MWRNWVVLIIAIWIIVAAFILQDTLLAKLLKAIIPAAVVVAFSLWSALARRKQA